MAIKKKSLRDLALTADSAYRTKIVEVPEWEGATVILREPSGGAWVKFREFVGEPEEDAPPLSAAQEFLRNKRADVILLIDVLLDESGTQIFSESDTDQLVEIYGQVHARLLRQAIALSSSQEYAEKKSRSR
ncbi:phage tail assembly chaperone [Phytobacter diazotrophicus]|uniref:phage tail assembly chaperone n=1 Tax=Phytobacter diazotrophicus TaxID=395631 RepID=UPI000CD17942|nr:phage tail assembly chaperone [Phytobacter diazotrophicus]AUU92105.1 phage tail protein [Enterobacteriaceae bacterium ENNIH3]AUV07850.1 phage tail protein [Enterobacteriaceae bacterium ENNIH2]MCL5501900.1 phage tail assembly chaperone [Escherichia coli]DAJ82087.1 MAG TPA: tail assembly chaperone protein [Caudoviricetes sp.]MDV2876065.1 phage tail assembly chaperone [Phytobacter diazotrophicus]